MLTYITLAVYHDHPIEDLADKAAGRVYSMSGITDVKVNAECLAVVHPAEYANGHASHDPS